MSHLYLDKEIKVHTLTRSASASLANKAAFDWTLCMKSVQQAQKSVQRAHIICLPLSFNDNLPNRLMFVPTLLFSFESCKHGEESGL